MVTTDTFRNKLEALIHASDLDENTPDFILSDYLSDCLETFDKAMSAREQWRSPHKWAAHRAEHSHD